MADQAAGNGGGPERDFARPFRLTIGDLVSDLLWPKLFRVPGLALRIERIALAVLLILLVGLVDQTLTAITPAEDEPVMVMLGERVGAGLERASEQVTQLAVGDALLNGWHGVWHGVTQTFTDAPWRASFVVPVAFLLYITLAVGISRMAVDDFARGKSLGFSEGLAWSLHGFWGSLMGHLLPIVVAGFLLALLVGGGYVVLVFPYVNLVGSIVSILLLLFGAVLVLVLLGFGLGGMMIAPTIAAEGDDGLDAVHRIYSYPLTRPGRYAVYTIVLFLQFAVVSSITLMLALAISRLTSFGMGLIFDWTGNADGLAIAYGATTEDMGPSGVAASAVVGFILKLPGLIAAGYLLCYWICGWSVQYLLLRQAADGQDVTDVYVPGAMEARVQQALAARAAGIQLDQGSPDSDDDD